MISNLLRWLKLLLKIVERSVLVDLGFSEVKCFQPRLITAIKFQTIILTLNNIFFKENIHEHAFYSP